MAISKLQPVVTSSLNANSITCPSNTGIVTSLVSLEPAIYSVTCASTTVATVDFLSSSGVVATAVTVNGSVSVNLATPATRIAAAIDTGTNIVVTITKVASALTATGSATLDTITTSGTYTGTSASGFAYALLVGGGGSGVAFTDGSNRGGGGGGSGGVAGKVVQLTGSMPVTIGGAGQASTFAGMTAGAGGTGSGITGGAGGVATGGTINVTPVPGNNGFEQFGPRGGDGGMAASPYQFITASFGVPGTGFISYNGPIQATNATGYGAGGGGSRNGNTPTAGRPGVLYILKF